MDECMKSIRVPSSVNKGMTRRQLLHGVACTLAGVAVSKLSGLLAAPGKSKELADETLAFIRRCARDDGGYNPSPDSLQLLRRNRLSSTDWHERGSARPLPGMVEGTTPRAGGLGREIS